MSDDLIGKVARALFENAEPGINWDDMTALCHEGYAVDARTAIAVVLKELKQRYGNIVLASVAECARENGIEL